MQAPPDLETRIAILKKKAAQERLTVTLDVLEFIADRIQKNIRELEGALIRVTAFASLNRTPVTMELAKQVLKDLLPDGGSTEINAAMIMPRRPPTSMSASRICAARHGCTTSPRPARSRCTCAGN